MTHVATPMTNVGVLGTGVVGQTLGSALVDLGHRVMLGSRDAANEKATAGRLALGSWRVTAHFATPLHSATS